MANEWAEDRFGSLVRFVSEKSQAKDANINTYVSTENMLADFGGITSASSLPLNGSVTRFKIGDTLFSNIRTYFKKVWQAKFDGCCSNDVLVFRPANTETLLPDYLHQICRWEKFTELSIRTSKGAKMPRGDKDALANFKFKIPPVEEQRAIAHILGTLDDKIELNRRRNQTLEAMARALFKDWFVDFGPVRAKMNLPSPPGRGAGGEGAPRQPRSKLPLPENLLEHARQLRGQATDAENLLWRLLRGQQLAGAKFRRQHAMPPYILDFYCHEAKLAVELDGGQHNQAPALQHDARRTAYLEARGIKVLRFWNNDVLRQTEAVLEAIYQALAARREGLPSPPAPLPTGEGNQKLFSPREKGWDEGAYLPPDLWELFPDRLDEEGKPEGWVMGTLADFASLNPESWSKRNVPEVIEYVDLANTKLGTIESAARLPWSEAPSRAQRILRTGDTIVGTVRPGNGSYALVGADGLTGSTGFAVLRPKQPTYREFVFLAATSAENIERLSHLADGAAYPAVRPDVVSASPVVKPDRDSLDDLMKAFSAVACEWIDSMEHNKVESKALAQLRDTLLPKLISGELRIKDAERIAEQMA